MEDMVKVSLLDVIGKRLSFHNICELIQKNIIQNSQCVKE